MQQSIVLNIEDALKLHTLKAEHMQQACASSGSCYNTVLKKTQDFADYAKSIGIDDYNEAERIANTVWFNYEFIKLMRANDKVTATFNYDMDSEFLQRCSG